MWYATANCSVCEIRQKHVQRSSHRSVHIISIPISAIIIHLPYALKAVCQPVQVANMPSMSIDLSLAIHSMCHVRLVSVLTIDLNQTLPGSPFNVHNRTRFSCQIYWCGPFIARLTYSSDGTRGRRGQKQFSTVFGLGLLFLPFAHLTVKRIMPQVRISTGLNIS